MALPVTRAFARYTELLEEFMRQRAAGPVSVERFKKFEDAMETCRQGMAPVEREMLDKMLQEQRVARRVAQNQVSFSVDTSKAPYTVPCPVCKAYALGACMSKRRERVESDDFPRLFPKEKFPADARVLEHPHPERQRSWEEHPQWRVRPM